MPHDDLDALFASPAALLEAGPARLTDLPDAGGGGVGREVFAQASAALGDAEVSRAEFASWLHFAAKVLGRESYAGQVAAAEPGMPWRTVWAWWRPLGAYRAAPNLCGDGCVEIWDGPDGRVLLKVRSLWTAEHWLDPATGERCPAPADGEFTERLEEAEEDGPFRSDPDDEEWELYRPETWEDPVPLGGGRCLLYEERGIVVLERNPAAAADFPGDGAELAGRGSAEPWFDGPVAGALPLDTARLAAAFGADHVVRTPQDRQPAALTHGPTRELIAAVGLPAWWACGSATFSLAWTEDGAKEPEPDADGLLHLGTVEVGYGFTRVLVDPGTGAVSAVSEDGGPFPFARNTETFVRLLETVYRFAGAFWSPHPAEDVHADFEREVEALEPGALDTDTPCGEAWEHVFAGVTELDVWGF
ncbi:SUKH-4 family immunity protein [Streptomyces sp. NPDC090445]|uniref:SUKH-4 family immunity protein n=1 Tax=Streptomyces sp. NPDC090445 TaxID=3365963 RepID=UPI0038226841